MIAKKHGTSPVKLYQLIKPLEGGAAGQVTAAAYQDPGIMVCHCVAGMFH